MRKNTGILYNYMQCTGAEAFVGADAYIGPAEQTVFTEIYGEFATSQRADVGIGPYKRAERCNTGSHWTFAFRCCLLPDLSGASRQLPFARGTGAGDPMKIFITAQNPPRFVMLAKRGGFFTFSVPPAAFVRRWRR